MNKTERIAIQKSNHGAWLIKLGADQDLTQRGKTYNQLRSIELSMGKHNEAYANGEMTEEEHNRMFDTCIGMVKKLFNGQLPEGFYLNTDPRGYALKIDDGVMRTHRYEWVERDMGGYGILAPEFN